MSQVKNHDTIVCGWDENKKLIFMRTFDFDNDLCERKGAQAAFDWVRDNCKGGYRMSDIENVDIIDPNDLPPRT